MDWRVGDGFGMIQVHYIRAHLLLGGLVLIGLDGYWSVALRLGTPNLVGHNEE